MPPGYRLGFETQREEISDEQLPVDGELPNWLVGRLLRNGPGQFEAGETPLRHWFDPYAMVRGFRIDGRSNSVTYTNRFVRSEDFEYARREGGVRRMLPGTPPDRSVFTRARHALGGAFQDNPSIGVQRLATRVAAVTESPTAIHFDPQTLETIDRRDLTVGLENVDFTLGHPHYDPDAEQFVNFGVSYGRETTYTLFERDPQTAAATPVGQVSFDDAPYAHTFALTDRFVVLAAIPFGLNTTQLLLDTLTGGTFVDNVGSFDRDAEFVVFDRETGDVRTRVPADPFFVYHHANAYVVDADGVPVADGPRDRRTRSADADESRSATGRNEASSDRDAADESAPDTADESAPDTADESNAEAGGSDGDSTGEPDNAGDESDTAAPSGAEEWQWLSETDGGTDITSATTRADDDRETAGDPAAILIDLIAYPDERAITELSIDNLRSDSPDVPTGDLVRYRVPLDGGRATRETLYGGQVEFPTIDYRNRVGRPYRYVYLAANDAGSSLPTRLVKYDHRRGTTVEWEPDGESYPAEPLFEPAPGADGEDTGVLLTTVLDADADRTEFVALDARELTEIARAPLPHRLPYGFHGQFYRTTNPVRSMA